MRARAGWVLAALAMPLTARGQEVVLRGQAEPPRGAVVRVDGAGVVIRPEAAAGTDPALAPVELVVPLDHVRAVLGPRSGEWEAIEPLASALWRAQARIDRDDVVGAQVVLERWGPRFAELSGPTAASAARVELRLALMVELPGASVRAMEAWVRALNAVEGAKEGPRWLIPPQDLAEGLIDPNSGLSPVVAPFWVDTPATRSALASIEPSGGDGRAGAMRAWYLAAARLDLGESVELPALSEPVEPALALVSDLVRARGGDSAERAEARARMESRLLRRPTEWERAWLWLGLGRSLLRESEREEKLRGVGALLRVPAMSGPPTLAAIARADAALALAGLGLAREAGVVKGELERDEGLGAGLASAVPGLRSIASVVRPAAAEVETPRTASEVERPEEPR